MQKYVQRLCPDIYIPISSFVLREKIYMDYSLSEVTINMKIPIDRPTEFAQILFATFVFILYVEKIL